MASVAMHSAIPASSASSARGRGDRRDRGAGRRRPRAGFRAARQSEAASGRGPRPRGARARSPVGQAPPRGRRRGDPAPRGSASPRRRSRPGAPDPPPRDERAVPARSRDPHRAGAAGRLGDGGHGHRSSPAPPRARTGRAPPPARWQGAPGGPEGPVPGPVERDHERPRHPFRHRWIVVLPGHASSPAPQGSDRPDE